jgi:hypothetical protein
MLNANTIVLYKNDKIQLVLYLDFRDRVIKASLAFSHLVVTTSSQCYIYRWGLLMQVFMLIC